MKKPGNSIKLKKKVLSGTLIIILMVIALSSNSLFSKKQYEDQDFTKPFNPESSNPDAFISIWQSSVIRLPLESTGTYNFFVDWGDGTNDTITAWDQAQRYHDYGVFGTYTVNITGTIEGWRFNYDFTRNFIQEIQQWGCLRLGNNERYFYGCENLRITATDSPDFTGTTSLSYMFYYCHNLGEGDSFNQWNTSMISDMSYMFYYATSFNHPIGNWDTSSVTTMESMFSSAYAFNQSIGTWDLNSVTSVEGMFYNAYSFNQPLNAWNTSRISDMSAMFSSASSFDQPLENWDTSSVTNMASLFYNATSFNGSIWSWNTSNVERMNSMFKYCDSFNQSIEMWDVSQVTYMSDMFAHTDSFNSPIGNWGVSNTQYFDWMFYQASSFDQSLGDWDISSGTSFSFMLSYTSLSVENYDETLIGWSELSLSSSKFFHAYGIMCSLAGSQARDYITSTFSWTIFDGGVDPNAFDFTLTSTADEIDLDGQFLLEWTASYRANNYSLYVYTDLITDLNSSLTVVSNQTDDVAHLIDNYTDGTYFFIVEAHNGYELTLTECIEVVVYIDREITVHSPAETISLSPDSQLVIQWNSTGLISHVKLEFYKGESYIIEIIASTENDGEFLWLIPAYIGQSEEYRVKIIDISNTTVFGFSKSFTISPDIPQQPKPSLTPLILSIVGLVIATGAAALTTYMFIELRKNRKMDILS
ncbi:MAG: BspA family leucine-rich repeat surface protein [Candidatus Lokiarchaeota archaeon]|nr:BspA family leucine-rich repeat surface protein [Candidatus Lokiarchaeota archaeon]